MLRFTLLIVNHHINQSIFIKEGIFKPFKHYAINLRYSFIIKNFTCKHRTNLLVALKKRLAFWYDLPVNCVNVYQNFKVPIHLGTVHYFYRADGRI